MFALDAESKVGETGVIEVITITTMEYDDLKSKSDQLKQLEKAYVQQGLDFMSTLGQADDLTDKYVSVSNQLKELQDAVMALEPFDDMFEAHYDNYACLHCYNYDPNHKPDCPVAKLRELLKEQGVSDVQE